MNCANPLPTTSCESTPRSEPAESREVFLTPAADIAEGSEGYRLLTEMPGVTREGLKVTLEGDRLILLGRRPRRSPAGDVLHRESTAADFRRVFVLHPAIDTSRIDARLENGILSVHLPKAELVKARRIQVNG